MTTLASPAWPDLPYPAWRATCDTLHRWTQIVGKIQLALAPMQNHWWQVALHVTARGLATAPMPHGDDTFEIAFDLLGQRLHVHDSRGRSRGMALRPRTVADFHGELTGILGELGFRVPIWRRPVEVDDDTPFHEDHHHGAYQRDAVERFFHAVSTADRLMRAFRSDFVGKASPSQFFWGSFDLAASRFSGRSAPPHPGGVPHLADHVTREACSHELFSCGWWPGNAQHPAPAFYAYAYPEPPGLRDRRLRPDEARWHDVLGELVLPWDDARRAPDPDRAVLAFFQSAYDAVADLAAWDRARLERR